MTFEMGTPWARKRGAESVLFALAIAGLLLAGLTGCRREAPAGARLAGDWDYDRMLGVAPNGGFEARRRFGFAHFEGPSAEGAWLKRRSGEPLETIAGVTLTDGSLVLSLGGGRSIRATVAGDTITGLVYRGDTPVDRVWFERRTTAPAWEPNYPLWPGTVSQAAYKVTIDPAVPMKARDGTTLMNFVARPVGDGAFGVVLERTPYLRTDRANGEFWASRGYIYVKQDVRGRGGSDGVLDMNAMQDSYEPGDPTPYLVDARELELNINEDYQKVDRERHDVVTYTTAPLTKDTEITGPMTATLWAATDARDTDWNVMILDVYPDGRAMHIQDGVARARFRKGFDRPTLLTPEEVNRYDIDLWSTALVIPAGHCIRVTVASAGFPKYDRNLNTGGDNERDTKYVVAHQRILHDAAHPSHVRLPIIPRQPR